MPRIGKTVLALDTETTGVDFRHGARPFLVTTCEGGRSPEWWEWPVDPLTRKVRYARDDLREIQQAIDGADILVLQNAKFDVTALTYLFRDAGLTLRWDWPKVRDTLLAGHLLASNQPHDLTSMVLHYLGVDIEPLEEATHAACEAARRWARSNRPDWRIAKKGLPEMPSAKEKGWKYDLWLPAAVCGEQGQWPETNVTATYAVADSASTVALWPVMEREIERRGLGMIYRERLKLLPIVTDMEERGVTLSRSRSEALRTEYRAESERAGKECVGIAAGLGYELTLPKNGNNRSLTGFVFGPLGCPVVKVSPKTASPSLDKYVLDDYAVTLPPSGKPLAFVRALRSKRQHDTALAYLEGYERFWQRLAGDTYRLFPSMNMTGTDTLRWSSSNPNAQNISKQEEVTLRAVFGPAPGREWWALDYENIELRIPAYEAGERAMIELFERPDDPPYYGSNHLLNFATVYPDLWEEGLKAVGYEKVGPHIKEHSPYYRPCKNGGFCKQYGGQRVKTDATFRRRGAYDLLDRRFSGLAELTRCLIDTADRLGYVETLPDKTVDPKRGYPLLCTSTEYGRVLPTVPLSYHVQGTAMQCTCKAMIRCEARLAEWRTQGFDGFITLQCHDELVFDLPAGGKRNLPRVRVLQRLMEQSGDDIGVPLKVAVTYCPVTWAKGEEPC